MLNDLARTFGDSEGEHSHGMMGMLTEDELMSLSTLRGSSFDRAWLESMIAHHEGAVDMATDVIDGGRHEELRRLANDIVTAQQAEIDLMTSLLS